MHETIQQVLRDRMQDDGVAVRHQDQTWTWREHLGEAAAEASAMIALADPARPLHVGVLLGNTPAMLRSMAAAALGGYVLCGINTTRRGDGLRADIRRADCQVLLVDPVHQPLIEALDLADVTVLDVTSPGYADVVSAAAPLVPHREVVATDPLMLIFTSGTSGDPKAVPFAHRDGGAQRKQPGAPTRGHPRRRLLSVDAAVPLQRSGGRLGRGRLQWRGDGSGQVLGIWLPAGRSALWRHLHELRRASRWRCSSAPRRGPTTTTTRCGSRSATKPPTATSTRSPVASAAG